MVHGIGLTTPIQQPQAGLDINRCNTLRADLPAQIALTFVVMCWVVGCTVVRAADFVSDDRNNEPAFVLEQLDLIDHLGRVVSPDSMRNRLNIVLLGYTSCPDICPLTLHNLKRAKTLMDSMGVDPDSYQVWFVSVDPERDTPEQLAQYVGFFDDSFLALTGGHRSLLRFVRNLRLYFKIQPHKVGDSYYLVDHSSQLVFIDSELNIVEVLSESEPAVLVQTVTTLLSGGS